MTVYGVISEYNPLHEGHLYHLARTRRLSGADALIVVMSGPAVQRGEPACADALARARWAVLAGADLVLELPAAYACHNAQLFARGAVGLLDALDCVEGFCFGSESGELAPLWEAARLLHSEPEPFSRQLREGLDRGLSFPRARQLAAQALLGPRAAALFTQANNVLALEYLQALLHLRSPLRPLTVARVGGGYRDGDAAVPLPGATAIRAALARGEDPAGLPPWVREELTRPIFADSLAPLVRWRLLSASPEELEQLPDMGEGLHLRLQRAARDHCGYEAMIAAALTKRYSRPRIARALLHALLGMTRADTELLRSRLPLFVRPLALGPRGAQLLSLIARSCSLPLVTQPARYRPEEPGEARLWQINKGAWDLHALLAGKPAGWELSARLTPLQPAISWADS